jgi:3-hydroxybutyrate dehydrogenase
MRGCVRTVLITGGTGVIGQQLVRTFCENGYDVTFQFKNSVDAARNLEKQYAICGLQMDFTVTTELRHGMYDVLINNAGINLTVATVHEYPLDAWQATLQVNVTAPFLLAQQCLPHMKAHSWGRVINISSLYGLHAEEKYVGYNVSKHGLRGLTRSIARDYGRDGVTANEICPGPVYSQMLIRNRESLAELHGQTLSGYLDEMKNEIPTGRLTLPSEVAAAALFLASDNAANINGVSVPIDGGRLS